MVGENISYEGQESVCETCGRSTDQHAGCDSCIPARPWEIHAAWVLRALLLATAIVFIVQGAFLYAIFCIMSILLVGVPAYLARTSKANLPVELELILLWFLVADNTLGRLVALYGTPWFDKALHLGNSAFIGFIGFLIIYLLLFTGRLHTSSLFNGVVILLATLGIGALWEITEYGLDLALHQGAQRSPIMPPLDETQCGISFWMVWGESSVLSLVRSISGVRIEAAVVSQPSVTIFPSGRKSESPPRSVP